MKVPKGQHIARIPERIWLHTHYLLSSHNIFKTYLHKRRREQQNQCQKHQQLGRLYKYIKTSALAIETTTGMIGWEEEVAQ